MGGLHLLLLVVCSLDLQAFVESGIRRGLTRSFLSNALLSYTCRSRNGLLCNGQGRCVGGRCMCYAGAFGDRCENQERLLLDRNARFDAVEPDRGPEFMACFGNDEGVCNGHGACVGGKCICEPDWGGITCEVQNRTGFCDTYRECAECTALLKSCPAKCSVSARFQLVYDFPISGGSFHRCRYKNVERDCSFYYQLASASTSGVITIMVKTCLKYRFTTERPSTEEYPVTQTSFSTTYEFSSTRTEMTTDASDSQTTSEDDEKDFCNKYRECAECTALFTACPDKCTTMANFNLVFGFPYNLGTFHRCRGKNDVRKCNFYYQLDSLRTAGRKNILVKACSQYGTSTELPMPPKQYVVSSIPTTKEIAKDDIKSSLPTTAKVTSVTDGITDRVTEDGMKSSIPTTAEVMSVTDDAVDDVTKDDIHDINNSERNRGTGNEGNLASNLIASRNAYIISVVNIIIFTRSAF